MKRWVLIWLTTVLVGTCMALQWWGVLGLYLWGRWLLSSLLTMAGVWVWARFCYLPGTEEDGQALPPDPHTTEEEGR